MKRIYFFIRNQFLLYFPLAGQHGRKLYAKYIISGSVAAITQIGVFYAFTRILGVELYLASTSIAFVFAVTVSFLLHKFWTFEDNDLSRIKWQLPVFVSIAFANLFLNGLMMYVLVSVLGFWYLGAQAVTMGVLAFGSFILNRTITFNNDNSSSNGNISA
jgi:putative flippase GtrA